MPRSVVYYTFHADDICSIDTAAALFANNLKTAGGDILVALAAYNGWYRGMSYKSATQAARSNCCRCQRQSGLSQEHKCVRLIFWDREP